MSRANKGQEAREMSRDRRQETLVDKERKRLMQILMR